MDIQLDYHFGYGRNNWPRDELRNRVGIAHPAQKELASACPPKLGPISLRGPVMKLTHKFAEMTPDKRPQDPHMDGSACASKPWSTAATIPTQCRRLSN